MWTSSALSISSSMPVILPAGPQQASWQSKAPGPGRALPAGVEELLLEPPSVQASPGLAGCEQLACT